MRLGKFADCPSSVFAGLLGGSPPGIQGPEASGRKEVIGKLAQYKAITPVNCAEFHLQWVTTKR